MPFTLSQLLAVTHPGSDVLVEVVSEDDGEATELRRLCREVYLGLETEEAMLGSDAEAYMTFIERYPIYGELEVLALLPEICVNGPDIPTLWVIVEAPPVPA